MKIPIETRKCCYTALIIVLITSCLLTSCATTQRPVIDPLKTHPRIVFRDLTKPVFLNATNRQNKTDITNQEREQKQEQEQEQKQKQKKQKIESISITNQTQQKKQN